MNSPRKLIMYIAASLDGYIAKPGDDLKFLDLVQKEGEDYGYYDFIESVDTVIVGRKTYDWVMKQVPEYPYSDKDVYIITRNSKATVGNLKFYNGNLKDLVLKLKSSVGKNIFVDGGAEIINLLLKDALIDELIISIIPVLLGDGTKLFSSERPEQLVELVSSKQFETGLVQLHYRKK